MRMMRRNKDYSIAHKHEFKPSKNRTYISCLEDEIERLEGLKELYKGSKNEIGNIESSILEYRSQYSILTGTIYLPPHKREELKKRQEQYFKHVANYKKLAPYTTFRKSEK